MRLALAITTFERPDALAAVLTSALAQSEAPDQIIVADDGSGPATRAVIEAATRSGPLLLHTVSQEHRGFRLTRLRNLAIAGTTADYIVFVDGDMVLHPEFVADHRRCARRGFFTQGVRVRLDPRATARLIEVPQRQPHGLARGLGAMRRAYAVHCPALQPLFRRVANPLIAIKGCNQGFWRSDLVRANGFDERIEGWGPEDKELCARLIHAGLRRQTLVFGGIAWHLAHSPAVRDRRDLNEKILAETIASRRVRCALGLDSHL